MLKPITWPEGKKFAFTVFDDTDAINHDNVHPVYSLLNDLGYKTTKSIWTRNGGREPLYGGLTCEDKDYLDWVLKLNRQGFEIGYHMASYHSCYRDEIISSLDKFKSLFNSPPRTMANHSNCLDNIYWGIDRVTGPLHRSAYKIMTRFSSKKFYGDKPESEYFWGDLCRENISYVRNFVFRETNTLKACPFFPYYDPLRPYVKNWFASSEGATVKPFTERISEANQDRLEEENGACIMYTHFAYGFTEGKGLNKRFVELMERLAKKGGWFVPVSELLDYIIAQRGEYTISDEERVNLERKWLYDKIFLGST